MAAVAAAASAHAQSGWTADVSAGHVTYQAAAARIATGSMIAGVRYLGTGTGWSYLYGGAPLQSGGVFWGAAGVGRRVAWGAGPVAVGIDLGGHGVAYRDQPTAFTGVSATLEALPLVAVQRGPLALQLRSGLLQNNDFYSDTTVTRRVHDTGFAARLVPLAGVQLGADARYMRAPEDDYPFVGGSVEAGRGPVRAWASGGRWLSDTLPTPAYGAGAAWAIRDGWEVSAAWQQETNNPLFRNLPRRTWSVQLSHHFGGGAEARLPAMAVAPRDAEGRIVIRVPVEEAQGAPSLVGEFTGWEPVPMMLEGSFWTARITVAAGVYRYGFHDAEGQWFLPPSITHRVDDGMGGSSAVLIVP